MKLYFIRHGQSQANLDGVYATPESPLTEQGREQARAAGIKVADLGITKLIASDFDRTIETAQIVADAAGLTKLTIISEPRLRELGVGNLAGTTNRYLSGYLAHQADPQADTTVEPLAHATDRLRSLIASLSDYRDETLLLVGHNGSGLLLQGILAGNVNDLDKRPSLPNAEPIDLWIPTSEVAV